MKKINFGLMSLTCLSFVYGANADEASQAKVPAPAAAEQAAPSSFTSAQLVEIEKLISSYISKHPEAIMGSLQAAQEAQQKEAVAVMEKAVIANKDKIFSDPASPVLGNPNGTQSLVVFMDPYCGYCKKFHAELEKLLKTNKDVKITFKDIPIMGPDSVLAIKAMLAAKKQDKYEQLQNAVFSADKHLNKRQLIKVATSLGIDTKKLEADMKDKAVQAQIDQSLELAKALGINGTPTLIVGESKVVPGYVDTEELNKMLQESIASADNNRQNETKS